MAPGTSVLERLAKKKKIEMKTNTPGKRKIREIRIAKYFKTFTRVKDVRYINHHGEEVY